MLSLLFQVILVPGDTVIVEGPKAIFAMVTVLGGVEELLLLLLLFEQETNIIEAIKIELVIVAILFFIFLILNYELKRIIRSLIDNAGTPPGVV